MSCLSCPMILVDPVPKDQLNRLTPCHIDKGETLRPRVTSIRTINAVVVLQWYLVVFRRWVGTWNSSLDLTSFGQTQKPFQSRRELSKLDDFHQFSNPTNSFPLRFSLSAQSEHVLKPRSEEVLASISGTVAMDLMK